MGKTKTIIISIIIVLGFVGLMLWGRSSQTTGALQNPGEISSLSALEKLYDFGTISMKNGLVDHVFRVTNSSDKDILVKKISTSCMCTNVYIESIGGEKGPCGMEGHGGYVPPANETIRTGESRELKVVYDPNAHGPAGVGAINRFIYLTDEFGDTLQLEIKAVVTP